MKWLYVVRHAKSSWKDGSLADFDRPLNKRGKRDAPRMGQHLLEVRKVKLDAMLASPAKRARATARHLAKALLFDEDHIAWRDRIYSGDVSDVLSIIRAVDEEHTHVMLVGHNPDLTMLVETLSGEQVDNVPTCGVFCLAFEITSWADVVAGKGQTVFFDVPKQI